jgi:hypothetical protein
MDVAAGQNLAGVIRQAFHAKGPVDHRAMALDQGHDALDAQQIRRHENIKMKNMAVHLLQVEQKFPQKDHIIVGNDT